MNEQEKLKTAQKIGKDTNVHYDIAERMRDGEDVSSALFRIALEDSVRGANKLMMGSNDACTKH